MRGAILIAILIFSAIRIGVSPSANIFRIVRIVRIIGSKYLSDSNAEMRKKGAILIPILIGPGSTCAYTRGTSKPCFKEVEDTRGSL